MPDRSEKGQVVLSAINFFEGGPLSILIDCLTYLNDSVYSVDYTIVVFVHKLSLFQTNAFERITFIELPKSRKSYLYRFYYEYYFFKQYAKKNNVSFWLSLHDMTPSLVNVKQAVYCHNPSVFNSDVFSNSLLQPKQFLFTFFYKYIYRFNIHNNQYVIVQQQWLRERFHQMFNINMEKIIVSKPKVEKIAVKETTQKSNTPYTFFYPAYPRPFKNIELICEAVKILNNQNVKPFNVLLTIDGTENLYSSKIFNSYKDVEHIEFLGLLPRSNVFDKYAEVDCMIFPSKLETWGLPISEFCEFKKPILLADAEYAKETIAGYDKAKFFNSDSPTELANYMSQLISGEKLTFDAINTVNYGWPYSNNWGDLFSLLLA